MQKQNIVSSSAFIGGKNASSPLSFDGVFSMRRRHKHDRWLIGWSETAKVKLI